MEKWENVSTLVRDNNFDTSSIEPGERKYMILISFYLKTLLGIQNRSHRAKIAKIAGNS